MKVFQKKLVAAVLAIIIIFIFIFMAYFIESRFFLIGKIIYPVYVSYNILYEKIAGIREENEKIIVYCDYYTWHNENHWQRGHSNKPLLGFYDSLDAKIIEQHIEWFQDYGIDVLKVEYLPQFDDSIIDGIMKADLKEVKLCLMYDSRLRFESIGYKNPPYDFNDSKIADTFISDMEHIAQTYFSSENYFTLEGRPVLWLYITRDYTGRYKEVIEKARQNLSLMGYDVYLVGDSVFWNYKLQQINAFDAVSCYSAYAGRPDNTAEFAERLKFLYIAWKVFSSVQGVDFIPSGIPAYNDTCLAEERICLPPLSGSAEDFKYQLEVIKNLTDPVNIAPYMSQVSIATFNEHQEGSSIEPSEEWGFEKIEQILKVFGNN